VEDEAAALLVMACPAVADGMDEGTAAFVGCALVKHLDFDGM